MRIAYQPVDCVHVQDQPDAYGQMYTCMPGVRPPVLVGAEHQCLYGLYMETSLLDVADGGTELDNCDTATTPEAEKACYAYLPSRVNAITGNLEDAARACNDLAPKGDLRDSCVKTFSIIRDSQEDLLAFADGDPDSFDANVTIAPVPGVDPPEGARSLGRAARPARLTARRHPSALLPCRGCAWPRTTDSSSRRGSRRAA